jgi:hypothetical protein
MMNVYTIFIYSFFKTEVINILGGIVVEDTTNLIDLHSLPAGVYVVKVQTNQRSQMKKISIQ